MISRTVRLTMMAVLLGLVLAPASSALVWSDGREDAVEERIALGNTILSGPEVDEPSATHAVALAQLPFRFVENEGQQDGRVAYYAQQGGASVYFTAKEAVMALPEAAVRQRFVGADREVEIRGAREQEVKCSILRGDSGGRSYSDIAAYAEVAYRDLYPGVDLKYTGSDGALRYELVVQPGTKVDTIRLAHAGVEGLRVAEDGDLLIVPEGGGTPLRVAAPTAYQDVAGERRAVDGAFALYEPGWHGQDYGFTVGQYDGDHPLVIQSDLSHASFLGGAGQDQAAAMTVDGEGNVYVTGETRSSDFPTTAGAYDETHNGNRDAFVSVFDPTLSTLQYSTLLGGSAWDEGMAIAVDGEGNVYVAGKTLSSDFPTTDGAYGGTLGDSFDAFVSALDPTLSTLQYSTLLGGSASDEAMAIALDGERNVYVAGKTLSSDFPTTEGAYADGLSGSVDAYVSVFDPTLSTLQYSTFLGGSGEEDATAIALNAAGRVYVVGQTGSADFPMTAGAYADVLSGSVDAYVSALDPTLSTLEHSTFLGGGGSERPYGLALDDAGRVYVTGHTPSGDFPTTAGAYQATRPSLTQAGFVSVLDPTLGTLAHSTYLGGTAVDQARSIALDSEGNVYVAGNTLSSSFPTTTGAFDETHNGNRDGFVSVLNPELSGLRYSTFLGGSGWDEVMTVSVGSAGRVSVAGWTESTDFPSTAGAYDEAFNDERDVFVSVLQMAREPHRIYLPLVVRQP